MGRRKNTFTKAIHHLKSKQIDEKLQLINEVPTNNTARIYVVEPEYTVQDPDIPGDVTRAVDFTQDALENGRDTTGLFDDNGTTILTIEPPGNTSYILGPMASMWYSWGNFSTIGYIRQSDRRMVDLGRITGQLENWNGSTGFISYGQLTLEQADWFRTTPKYENYRAFYPGPPSNAPDQYGRYYCVITGTSKPTTRTPPPRRVPPTLGGFDPNLPPGSARPKRDRNNMSDAELYKLGLYRGSDGKLYPLPTNTGKTEYDALDPVNLAFNAILARLGLAAAMAFRVWANKGKNERIPNEDAASWEKLWADDLKQRGQSDASFAAGEKPPLFGRPDQAFNPFRPAEKGGPGSGPTPAIRQLFGRGAKPATAAGSENKKQNQKNSYDSQGQVLTESYQRILKDLKKPYQLPEEKKEKIKHRPRVIGSESRTINPDLMKKAEVPTSFKPMEEKLWGKYEKEQNARASQERKNEVLDHLGGSDHFWEYMTETSKQKSKDIMYGNFSDNKKFSVVRKEQLKGDNLLFIVDENGNKENILQSELSIKIADEMNRELFQQYFKEQETLQADKDPLFKKVKDKLKPIIDYPDKPSKLGYPDQPPPESVNGWHPEYGNKGDYYNKLDPQSAEAMPPTGNAEIDAKVQKAKRIKKVLGKKG